MTFAGVTRLPIRVQLAMLLVVMQFLAHGLTLWLVNISAPSPGGRTTQVALSAAEPFLTALRIAPTPAEAQTILAPLLQADPRFSLARSAPPADPALREQAVAEVVNATVPPAWRGRIDTFLAPAGSGFPSFPNPSVSLAAALPDGTWLIFHPATGNIWTLFPKIVATLGLMALALPLTFLSVWAGMALSAPIAALARGAERFSADLNAPPIPETGPQEVRRASAAFNLMRGKLQKMVETRAQTLAAISHDMRTPLTRLRLRVDALPGEETSNALRKDLDVLQRMINSALDFLRTEQLPFRPDRVDMAVLARTVADDFADRGHDVTYDGPPHLSVWCDQDMMRRVLENLIDNALHYAGDAEVTLTDRGADGVRLTVSDHGPGIPANQRAEVIEPFHRAAAIREGRDSQGFGLGLSIACDFVARHGGQLSLTDNLPSGLVVVIDLPRVAVALAKGPVR